MVELPKNKTTASLHDLTDFAISKQVVEDFPKVMLMYDKLIPALEKYQHYLAVSSVILAVQDAQTLMRMQMEQFEKIHESRGKVGES
jgi:hypothetical protein